MGAQQANMHLSSWPIWIVRLRKQGSKRLHADLDFFRGDFTGSRPREQGRSPLCGCTKLGSSARRGTLEILICDRGGQHRAQRS
ncbi:hypothetical protein [Sinorhizobium meliloti]|uniref:hypothetical protein n=1 Tax=Rhizobium meliloti TaxID=382 RepID=UPI0012955B49|nr:hypothetical protein [Sinorhizobium meliloti]MQU91740.1 hypothetical protein [Sinorhizobium meliloti]MQV01790.1 hypothetical protein [Sinorhizobium meliloti]